MPKDLQAMNGKGHPGPWTHPSEGDSPLLIFLSVQCLLESSVNQGSWMNEFIGLNNAKAMQTIM